MEAVGDDGSFAITQMHAPNVGEVTWHTYGPQAAAAIASDPGVAFVL